MKKILIILVLSTLCNYCQAQGGGTTNPNNSYYICLVKYTYDANGNRTHRAYSCEWHNTLQSSKIAKPTEPYSIVFPNPNTGVFKIATSIEYQNAIVKIKNMQGQLLKEFVYSGIELEIDIRNLPIGQYIIELIDASKTEVHKIIKQ